MNIIFQSGEFYSDGSFWSELFIQVIGALIGVLSAIYLFFRQLRINKEAEEIKKKQFEEDKLRYFAGTLNSVIELVMLQIKRIDEFVEEVSKNFIDVPLLRMFPTHEIDRLANKINHEDYYHAFKNRSDEEKDAAEKFTAINGALYYFDGVFKQIVLFLEKENMYSYQKKLTYREHINNTQKKLSILLTRLKEEGDTHLFERLNELIINHINRVNVDPANLILPKEQFLDPLMNTVIHYLGDSEIYALADEVRLARIKYSDIEMSNRHMVEEFKGYSTDISSALEKLKSYAQILERYGYYQKGTLNKQPEKEK